jgi:hypothetical protein
MASIGYLAVGDIDLNGDGTPDCLIGSNYLAGVVYAVSGRGGLLYQITSQPGAPFGAGIGKFIDFNHDGCQDFLLGNYVLPNGAVDIRSGRDGSLLRRITCPPAIARHGATAAMIGDQDGDGMPDVVSGASAPFIPGVLTILSSQSGTVLRQWQVNTVGGDDFGWPQVAAADIDRDGFDDIVANARNGNAGQYIFSGRDGSLIEFYDFPNDHLAGPVEALPPQGSDPFPRYVCHGGSLDVTGMSLFSGAPEGVERIGTGSSGSLPRMPVLGLRELPPSSFRLTLSAAEPGAFAILVIGLSQPGTYLPLAPLGFPNCHLYVQPDVIALFQAGSTGSDSGYVAHDIPRRLVAAATLQSPPVDLQWVVLGSGATFGGGVSEALRVRLQ